MSIQNIRSTTGQMPPMEAVIPPAGTPARLPAEQKPAVTAADLRQVAADVEKIVRSAGRSLHFQVDSGSGEVIVRVVDAESGDVIRQIPSEEFLRLARWLGSRDATDVSLICDTCA